MKKYGLLFVLLTLISMLGSASNEVYKEAMQREIVQLWQAATVSELQSAANAFTRISSLNPEEWLPPYYVAVAYAQMGFRSDESITVKDGYFSQAKEHIKKAARLSENNSEIIAVEGFIIMGELSLDPGARGQNLSPLAMQTLGRAMELEPENPRAMIMMAQMELGTAQFFGQSPEKACRLAKISRDRFAQEASEVGKDSIYPTWGSVMAEQMMRSCP